MDGSGVVANVMLAASQLPASTAAFLVLIAPSPSVVLTVCMRPRSVGVCRFLFFSIVQYDYQTTFTWRSFKLGKGSRGIILVATKAGFFVVGLFVPRLSNVCVLSVMRAMTRQDAWLV